MADSGISFAGTFLRIGLALVLVLATFNPSGYSLVHWVATPPVAFTPGKALAILALGIGWVVCLRTAFIALGKVGLLLGVGLFAALVWLLVDRDLLSLTGSAIVWVGLIVVGLLLGIGLSWSLIRAKATGQIEVS
jgi:branched-subunit amino acid transport protein AzlD